MAISVYLSLSVETINKRMANELTHKIYICGIEGECCVVRFICIQEPMLLENLNPCKQVRDQQRLL